MLSYSPATPVYFKSSPEAIKQKATILSSSRDPNNVLEYSLRLPEKLKTIDGVASNQLSFRGSLKYKKKVKKDTKLSRAVSSASGEDDTPNCSKESTRATEKRRDNESSKDEQVEKKSSKKRKKGSGNEVKNGKKHEYHCAICNVNCTSESDYQDHLNGNRHKKKMKIHDASVVQGVANQIIADEIAEEQNKKYPGERVEKKSNKKHKKRSGKQVEKKSNKKRKQAANAPPSNNNKKATDTFQPTKPKKKKRKKGPPVDESKLPPEERRRREEQRRMQSSIGDVWSGEEDISG